MRSYTRGSCESLSGIQSRVASRPKVTQLPALLLLNHRYVLGLPAMQRIRGVNVLLSGLQGLGAEVAKNLVLMGVGSLTLHDPQPTCWADLAAQVRVLGVSMLSLRAGPKGFVRFD